MTHYTVTFTGTNKEKLEQAWKECQWYLGERGMEHLATLKMELKSDSCRQRIHAGRMFCTFVGIRGYWPEHAIKLYLVK